MSAVKEYKMGIIDESEFRMAMSMEFAGDNEPEYDGCECEHCIHYVEGTETECNLPESACYRHSEFVPVDE